MVLRLLHLVALVILTIACAGSTHRGGEGASLAGPAERAARAQVGADSEAVGSRVQRPLHALPDVSGREVSEADVDDEEIDCDDDTRSEVAAPPPARLHGLRAGCTRGRAWRGEPSRDTSRFAIRVGLPRGPPA